MSDLKKAVEKLNGLAAFYDTYCGGLGSPIQRINDKARARKNNANAIRIVLSALSRAEAERDLLAAECRAWRALEHDERNCNEAALTAALAATDAAGVLEEGK